MKIKMMITSLVLFLAVGTTTFGIFAQQENGKMISVEERQEQREKIDAWRTAFVVEKSGMTPDESSKFWPLYQEYREKKRKLKSGDGHQGAEIDRHRADLKDEYYQKYLGFMSEEKVDLTMEALKIFRGKIKDLIDKDNK